MITAISASLVVVAVAALVSAGLFPACDLPSQVAVAVIWGFVGGLIATLFS